MLTKNGYKLQADDSWWGDACLEEGRFLKPKCDTMKRNAKRPGLILLVVLGMLALFSMLAVTYVVFSSQSRAASVALARSEIRGQKSRKALMDEAIKELIRGSTNVESAVFGHDLLGDLYGNAESLTPLTVAIRNRQFNPENGAPFGMSYDENNGLQRPMILAGHYLRIPLEPGGTYGAPTLLPAQHDVLNGRVITFPNGSGPLSGQSFRIIRYIGQVGTFTAPVSLEQRYRFSQSYSVTIDLAEGDLDQSHSGVDAVTSNPVTLSVRDWLATFPPSAGTGTWAAGVYGCYEIVGLTAAKTLSGGYTVMINAPALNSHGVGILSDGSSQLHYLRTGAHPLVGSEVNEMAVALQTRYQSLSDLSPLTGAAGTMTNAVSQTDINNDPTINRTTTLVLGDSDEPYDAPDYQNMYLAYRESGASSSEHIIPSFHRASLINYIVNLQNPLQWTEQEFLATLRRIQLAAGRPLSIDVTVPSGAYASHPEFSGSNAGQAGRVPWLRLSIANWSDWPATGWPEFQQWLNFLTLGPWDVDNDLDGVPDSVWVDAGLPLETSSDGTLLKALVAYYVVDLDNKLDVNAVGNIAQSNRRGAPFGPGDQYGFAVTDSSFHRFGLGNYLSQGNGVGAAETSFRHLFSKAPNFTTRDAQEQAYQDFLINRYRRNASYAGEIFPGSHVDDALSQLWHREKLLAFRHGSLPGLPYSPTGRVSIGIDRLGNPMVWNVNATINESTNDPYEARLIGEAYQDLPISLAQWERLYRVGDPDRTTLPSRLEDLMGETPVSMAGSTLRHEITPISRHLRVPMLAARGRQPASATSQGVLIERGPGSFLTLVNTVRQMRGDAVIPTGSFRTLFPLEFNRGVPMDLNRPFGNGIDDDNDGEIDEPNEFVTDQGGTTGIVYTGQRARYVTGTGQVGYVGNVLEDYFEANLLNQTLATGDKLTLAATDPDITYTGGSSTNPIFWGQETRQLYARHLYCLAQLIVPEDYVFPSVSRAYTLDLLDKRRNGTAAEQAAAQTTLRDMRGRILAQWAVNVVDFRDSDSVMTRFPYDPDPFRNAAFADDYTWDVRQGGTTTHVAWGVEQPELLMTETFATHDTRVRRDAMANPKRFDQYRIPQGSLFLEFYCPRSTVLGTGSGNNQQAPGVSSGLYTTRLASHPRPNSVALDLGKLTPTLTGFARFPVWRVYLGNPKDIGATQTLKTPNERLLANPDDLGSHVKRHELTYQFPNGNWAYSSSGVDTNSQNAAANAGLDFDLTTDGAEELDAPNPASSRVILFARDPADNTLPFTPTYANCPGVADPDAQVYVNRTGPRSLLGGQYLVVGPRSSTYFGSRTNAPAGPQNIPNAHRIEFDFGGGNELTGPATTGDWLRLFKADNTEIGQRATMADCVTMVAAADAPTAWTSGDAASQIGVNVSEPLVGVNYYAEPTYPLNATDTAGDTSGDTGAAGFANLPYDAYNDFNTDPSPPSAIPPYDRGQSNTPLANWDPDGDGNVNYVDMDNDMSLSSGDVMEAGTAIDWSTAYLQRLADPNKPWHPTFNPYLTVDWMPIDLTVFHGEDDDTDLDPPNDLRFASRQKVGQTLDSNSLAYDVSGTTGQTFMSAMSDVPTQVAPMVAPPTPAPFLEYELNTDDGPGTSARPTSADGTNAFVTLGFLNSGFKLSGEDGSLTFATRFRGAPAEPIAGGSSTDWHPDALFWPNRSFASTFELMWVPTSSPGQLMQEFSATAAAGNQSMYASSFRNDDDGGASPPGSFMPIDPRTPTAPVSPAFPAAANWPNDAGAAWPQPPTQQPPILASPNTGLAVSGTNIEPGSQSPYAYLLNFFQEVSELQIPNDNPQTDMINDRHPKNVALTMLFDMVETPSPWVDSYKTESPVNLQWQNFSGFGGGFQAVQASENIVFAPLRAPNNRMTNFVEPGRINLNTVAEPNVIHGLFSNVFAPSDVDFPPFESVARPFGQIEDIDHNGNNVLDTPLTADGWRHAVGATRVQTIWTAISNSRRGFDTVTGAYLPAYNPDPTRFNPFFPTRFAGIFRPASEAGMVPKTRNPFPQFPLSPSPNPVPGDPTYDAAFVEHQRLFRLAEGKGVLDLYTRLSPSNATLLRPISAAAFNGQDVFNTPLVQDTAGVYKPDSLPLFTDTSAAKNHPYTQFYPLTRIQNLVTGRSNVFAVYMTVGLFEYDESTDSVGLEYRADRGEAKKYRAFYVVDRTKPVGYQVGVDHNVENTILVRRYIDTED